MIFRGQTATVGSCYLQLKWGILTDKIRKKERVSRDLYKDRDNSEVSGPRTIRTRSCHPGPGDLEIVTKLVIRVALSCDGLKDQFGEGYVVAESAGEVLGCAGIEIHGTCGLLRSVAVIPDRRRWGVGEILVTDRLEWARSRGILMVYLLTETAAGYFERFGFERVDRADVPTEIRASHEFSVMCPETAEVMLLRL
jgi:amino-acid N-acetyltransferase